MTLKVVGKEIQRGREGGMGERERESEGGRGRDGWGRKRRGGGVDVVLEHVCLSKQAAVCNGSASAT